MTLVQAAAGLAGAGTLVLGGSPGTGRARWVPGERLEHLFEARCDATPDAIAVDGPEGPVTYAALDRRANQLASYLAGRGAAGPGERVALLLDEPLDSYVAMLAVLKLGAAYVPLDAGYPADRLDYILGDADATAVITSAGLTDRLPRDSGVPAIVLDAIRDDVAAQPGERTGRPGPDDDGGLGGLAYVIYTSGTTGRPKGVAIEHAAICNFVRVAADTYGLRADDRMYQGLTIAFDFSVEEIWLAWIVGATLVPKPGRASLVGPELADFVRERGVTAMCCVPTLLATIHGDLPGLRFLLVSGETCPPDMVHRWARDGRRLLNVYGPTEATVTATCAVLHPDRPVTIGTPLPTYSIVILDPDHPDRALSRGEMGEIGIAGIGLARGYLNLVEKTRSAFVDDFVGIADNPSGRIYRTGDLGCINGDGEVEHHGRIDSQVKVRGYRIELEEIEAVLRCQPGVEQAAVGTLERGDLVELVAYVRTAAGGTLDAGELMAGVREQLPAHMVPSYLEALDELPVMPSGKIDRRRLPAPVRPRLTAQRELVGPATATEALLARHMAEVLGLDAVSVEAHFFDDLGASSLLLGRFNAAVAACGGPAVSMREVYGHPTLRSLAAELDGRIGDGPSGATPPGDLDLPGPVGRVRYRLCALLQAGAFLVYLSVVAVAVDRGAGWLGAANGVGSIYARAVAFGAMLLLGSTAAAIASKWLLIGRFRAGRTRIWSVAYFRFWVVRTLLVANPLGRMTVGTPLYPWYLRALGADVDPTALVLSTHLPVCTDLIRIGPGAVVRKDAYFNGYRARAGSIERGPVEIGRDAYVGEMTVLDVGTTIGEGGQIGHSSSLHTGQVVPPGQCWHGSPAVPADPGADYRGPGPVPGSESRARRRRVLAATGRLVAAFAVAGPASALLLTLLTAHSPLTSLPIADAPAVAGALLGGLLVVGLAVNVAVPRLLSPLLRPGQVYPVHGFHFGVQRLVSRVANIRYFTLLFGDSSAIPYYLRALGYRLGVIEQTGSNFGTAIKQDVPALSYIGTGTMVSDGLSMLNLDVSATSFRVRPVVVGPQNFIGNGIAFSADARTGSNCLLATKVMVPVSGPVRENVGLLGSPCFEIPREVDRAGAAAVPPGPERDRLLARKAVHNTVTVALHLLTRYVLLVGMVAIALAPWSDAGWSGWLETGASDLLDLLVTVAVFSLAEAAVRGFRRQQPRSCSIYEPAFWRHERYWKVPSIGYLRVFDGTPWKLPLWRALGVRIGPRVYDDGCMIVERTLATVGAGACLNMASTLQAHSLEDGAFKSDHQSVGEGCTVGTAALVHYGTVVEAGAVVDTDAFLMKGSTVTAGSHWTGNPAAPVQVPVTTSGEVMR